MKKIAIVLVVSLLLATSAFAANHAIRPDCTYSGDGSNWGCAASPGASGAWNAIPSTLVRGDTYYFGDGTLTQTYLLDDANSGETYITFKKATAADYGGLSSWSASYGDGQTIFYPAVTHYNATFIYTYGSTNGYYKFDGVKGIGSTNPDDYGFAFKQQNRNPGSGQTMLIYNSENAYAIGQIVSNCAFVTLGSECVSDGCYHNGTRCQKALTGGVNALYYGNLFKGSDNPVWAIFGGTTVDSNIFMDHWSDSNTWYSPITEYGCHGQQIVTQASNITIKNNLFIDSTGSATISDPYNNVHTVNGWYIYNNIFLSNTAGGGVVGREDPMAATYNNIKFYNNTIYGGNGFMDMRPLVAGTGNEVKNNLYYGSSYGFLSGTTGGSSWTWANNYHDSTSTSLGGFTPSNDKTETIGATTLFTSPSTYNFTLKSETTVAINNGATLGSPYNIDRAGNTRVAPYDMGAYESGSEAPPDDNPMTVSAGSDRATNTASETVTGTVADDDGVASVSWSNSRGGSGACTGTTSFSCAEITMANGINSITITALDDLGNSGSDSVDLTYYVSVSNGTVVTVTMPQLIYFKASSAGNYKLTGSVNSSDGAVNSFFIDIGADPAGSATKQWHLDYPTTGYDEQDARWGTWDNPDAYQSPTIWALSGANQILYIREREYGTLIESVKFVSMSADETAPSVTIATSSPQSVTSDALTVTGTATDAVWGTGSVCKFRVGAEPDADNGTDCTGTTSWSCAATGFSLGANTLYIECGDAVPNWSTGNSITVNYGTPTPLPAVTMRGASIAGGTFK